MEAGWWDAPLMLRDLANLHYTNADAEISIYLNLIVTILELFTRNVRIFL